jgi:hypothetical protein
MNVSPNGKPKPENSDQWSEDEAREMEQVGAFLQRWSAPEPDPAAKAHLFEALDAEFEGRAQHAAPLQALVDADGNRARHAAPLQTLGVEERARRSIGGVRERAVPRRDLRWGWLILRSQVRLVHPATWVASGLVIALGALVTLIFYRSAHTGADLPLVIIAPLVAACGVAFLYGLEADPAMELQLATPVSARLVLMARLALLFGFNLAITLACSVALTLAGAQISLFPLIAAWLAPMTFLTALAFFLSVLFFDSLASVLISLLLWIGTALRHFLQEATLIIPDVLHANFYPLMLVTAPVLVVLALWLAEREERWTLGGTR